MRNILVGVGLLSLSLSANVLAGEKIERSLDVSQESYITVEHVNGLADIQAWDKSEVRVKGTLGNQTKSFTFKRDGKDVLIKVKVKVKDKRRWGNQEPDDVDKLSIFVPRNSQLNYRAVNANLVLTGVHGGSKVETVNGSINVKELAGRNSLESINGKIFASELQGNVRIETVNGKIYSRSSLGEEDVYQSVNGDIDVKSESADISVETVNGSIELDLARVSKLNLDTVNGSVNATFELDSDGEVDASSVGGSIYLSLQRDVSARFDIEGHAGGRLTNNLSGDKVQKTKYGPRRWLKFSLNDGGAKVRVSTVNGKVKLDKR
jgi:DUF4097 and DUF4098 domain-containing protein YvlB